MAKKAANEEEVYEEVITEAEPEIEEEVFEAEVEDAAPKKKINAKSVLKKIGKGVGIGLLIGASYVLGCKVTEKKHSDQQDQFDDYSEPLPIETKDEVEITEF